MINATNTISAMSEPEIGCSRSGFEVWLWGVIPGLVCAGFIAVSAPVSAQDITDPPEPMTAVETPAFSDEAAPDAGAVDETPSQEQVVKAPVSEEPGALQTDTTTESDGTVTSDSGVAPEFETPVLPQEISAPQALPKVAVNTWLRAWDTTRTFLRNGGPSIWAIAALSVITLALILWKIWRLALIGAWSTGKAGRALNAFEHGQYDTALATVRGRTGIRSKVVFSALSAIRHLPEDRAREETARVARREIGNAGTGLRALELIATIAPLLGLLGTVLGMIAAFQALQQAGSRADPSLLAGGIWEALLTTAAGMAVAIPASAALTWFEAVIDRIRRDVEDGAARIFIAEEPATVKLAAE